MILQLLNTQATPYNAEYSCEQQPTNTPIAGCLRFLIAQAH